MQEYLEYRLGSEFKLVVSAQHGIGRKIAIIAPQLVPVIDVEINFRVGTGVKPVEEILLRRRTGKAGSFRESIFGDFTLAIFGGARGNPGRLWQTRWLWQLRWSRSNSPTGRTLTDAVERRFEYNLISFPPTLQYRFGSISVTSAGEKRHLRAWERNVIR